VLVVRRRVVAAVGQADVPDFAQPGKGGWHCRAAERSYSGPVSQILGRVNLACEAVAIGDFHVGPRFPENSAEPGRHLYLIEFAGASPNLAAFSAELDAALCRLNDDYRAHRQGNLNMASPEIQLVRRGGFAEWLRSRGQLGGQHKVPRMDNTGRLTAALSPWLVDRQVLVMPQ